MGRLLAGKYLLERLLGRGAMGEVYLASDGPQQVAVKVMLPEVARNLEYVARFRREAQASISLAHPGVIRVIEQGEDAGELFMVMELLTGKSASEWLGDGHLPPLAEVVAVMAAVLDAIGAAHAAGILHRDLKPSNIFLCEGPGGRSIKVLDFGLARVTTTPGNSLTQTSMVAGTPHYMSPEQCQSLKEVGPATDLYALGCALTEMLQGEPPFHGGDPAEILAQQLFMPPPPLRRPPGAEPVPAALEDLRLAMLAKNPDERPASAAEVKARMQAAFEAGAAVSARSALPVAVARLSELDGGVTPYCLTGLAAHGVHAAYASGPRELMAEGVKAIVLDAGPACGDALAFLQQLKKLHTTTGVLVCLQAPSTEQLGALIEAGAVDVLPYPVAPETLARRLQRALKKARSAG